MIFASNKMRTEISINRQTPATFGLVAKGVREGKDYGN